MTTQLYDLTLPLFLRALNALAAILDKAEAHAAETGMPLAELFDARLAPDMYSLAGQVQRLSDTAKGTAIRIGKLDPVAFPDDEASFADLKARIAKTVALLESVPPEAINGREEAEVTLTTPSKTLHFTGRSYALDFALPNFYFHVTAAYAILRHKGVPLSKLDYLGAR